MLTGRNAQLLTLVAVAREYQLVHTVFSTAGQDLSNQFTAYRDTVERSVVDESDTERPSRCRTFRTLSGKRCRWSGLSGCA